MSDVEPSEDRRVKRRRSGQASAGLGALCLAALAVATGLATAVVPDALPWLKNPVIVWPAVGVLAVLTAGFAVRTARSTDSGPTGARTAALAVSAAAPLPEVGPTENRGEPIAVLRRPGGDLFIYNEEALFRIVELPWQLDPRKSEKS
jgi:hypothetical protein